MQGAQRRVAVDAGGGVRRESPDLPLPVEPPFPMRPFPDGRCWCLEEWKIEK